MVSYGIASWDVILDNAWTCSMILGSLFMVYMHLKIQDRCVRSLVKWKKSAIGLIEAHEKYEIDNTFEAYYKDLHHRVHEAKRSSDLQHELINMDEYKIEWLIQEYRHIKVIDGVIRAWQQGSMPRIGLSDKEYEND